MIFQHFFSNVFLEQPYMIINYLLIELNPEILSIENSHMNDSDFQLSTDFSKTLEDTSGWHQTVKSHTCQRSWTRIILNFKIGLSIAT